MKNWTIVDRWDCASAQEAMIVSTDGADGEERYLLVQLRDHEAGPAYWGLALRLRDGDTRETLDSDAGLECPMTVMDRAINGYDHDRPILTNWPARLVHNIANIAR